MGKRRNRTESKQDETFETEIKTMYDLQGWDPEHEELRTTTKEDTKRKKNEEKEESKITHNSIESKRNNKPNRNEERTRTTNRRYCRISKGGEATHSNANSKKELQRNETKRNTDSNSGSDTKTRSIERQRCGNFNTINRTNT